MIEAITYNGRHFRSRLSLAQSLGCSYEKIQAMLDDGRAAYYDEPVTWSEVMINGTTYYSLPEAAYMTGRSMDAIQRSIEIGSYPTKNYSRSALIASFKPAPYEPRLTPFYEFVKGAACQTAQALT